MFCVYWFISALSASTGCHYGQLLAMTAVMARAQDVSFLSFLVTGLSLSGIQMSFKYG